MLAGFQSSAFQRNAYQLVAESAPAFESGAFQVTGFQTGVDPSVAFESGAFQHTGFQTGKGKVKPQNLFDTSQGVARNLARNLRFERIEDGSARFTPQKSNQRSYGVTATGYARAAFRTVASKSHSWALGASANGFAQPIAGARVSAKSSEVTCSANGFASISPSGTPVRASCFTGDITGGASASYSNKKAVASGVNSVSGLGIHNPTDEMLATIAAHVLTRKQKRVSFQHIK